MDANVEKALTDQLKKATQIVEDQVDKEIEKLEKLDEDDFDTIRQRRLAAMKKQAAQNEEWKRKGHGEYSECDEKEFFDVCKKSKRIVCHFYRNSTFRCKIVDKHLEELSKKHMESRFVKINVEKAPFLVERLKIKVLPSVALLKDQQVVDYVVGFDELGGTDDFSTEMMEWRLAKSDIINYQGDINRPPEADGQKKSTSHVTVASKSSIRAQREDDSDSD